MAGDRTSLESIMTIRANEEDSFFSLEEINTLKENIQNKKIEKEIPLRFILENYKDGLYYNLAILKNDKETKKELLHFFVECFEKYSPKAETAPEIQEAFTMVKNYVNKGAMKSESLDIQKALFHKKETLLKEFFGKSFFGFSNSDEKRTLRIQKEINECTSVKNILRIFHKKIFSFSPLIEEKKIVLHIFILTIFERLISGDPKTIKGICQSVSLGKIVEKPFYTKVRANLPLIMAGLSLPFVAMLYGFAQTAVVMSIPFIIFVLFFASIDIVQDNFYLEVEQTNTEFVLKKIREDFIEKFATA